MNWRNLLAGMLLIAGHGDIRLEKRLINRELGFQLDYPAQYRPNKNLRLWRDEQQGLANVCANMQGHESCIRIILDKRPFDLEILRHDYSPTGMEDYQPAPIHVGKSTFYYYGPGGGGVAYPDNYYFDLDGRILIILFDGPYVDDKTPTEEMKRLEREILDTFRLLPNQAK